MDDQLKVPAVKTQETVAETTDRDQAEEEKKRQKVIACVS